MKKILLAILAALLTFSPGANHTALADDYPPEAYDSWSQSAELFTAEELDDLLAPIALYPDPLLAQILPAATFIDQIDAAARYVGKYGSAARIDDQLWDVSVRAVAHYPKILFMMDQKYDWCVSLGQAYVNQPQDVLDAIQRLRAEARAFGNLATTPQQEVIIEGDYIRIIPAEPRVIYVPTYDPFVVYAEPLPYGFITFGIGFTIGAWLNRDCDWHRQRIYYHGWRGGGWIDRSRRYVHHRRSSYINNNYTVININRRVVQHDSVRYREDIRRNVEFRREHRRPGTPGRERRPGTSERRPSQPTAGSPPHSTRPAPTAGQPRQQPRRGGAVTPPASQRQPAITPPTSPGTTAGTTPAPPRTTSGTTSAPPPVTTGSQAQPRSNRSGFSRGREQRVVQPPNTGFGVYGSSTETKTYRERGENSRGNMQRFNRQPSATPQVSRPAPSVPRQAAPAPSAPRQSAPANRGGGSQRERR